MRIVAGRWRGRAIAAPAGDLVRPTGDRVRESWMSIVHSVLPEARVLDLCAGSGALGLEALSRGAATCDFVEIATPAVRVIQENLDRLGGHDGAAIHRVDAGAAEPAGYLRPADAEHIRHTRRGAEVVAEDGDLVGSGKRHGNP